MYPALTSALIYRTSLVPEQWYMLVPFWEKDFNLFHVLYTAPSIEFSFL